MIKCAIFDFDGTLFDSMPAWEGIGERFIESCGFEVKEELKDVINNLSMQECSAFLKETYDLEITTREIIQRINKLVEPAYYHRVLPKPGVIELLDYFYNNDISCYIATASDRYLIEAALKRCQLDKYFVKILTCSEVGYSKSHPQIYLEALKLAECPEDKAIVFEDAYYAIVTAKKAGLRVVGIKDLSEPKQNEIKKSVDLYLEEYNIASILHNF